jgi:hypothetical protein
MSERVFLVRQPLTKSVLMVAGLGLGAASTGIAAFGAPGDRGERE